jgi:hypothetical protein
VFAYAAPGGDFRRPSILRATLQLLGAAAAAVALYWTGLRLFGGALAEADRYGALPLAALLLGEIAVAGLASLPVLALAAVWLRDLAAAPVPRVWPDLCRAVLAAWGYVLAAFVLAALAFSLLLAIVPASWLGTEPDLWQPVLAHDLLLLLLWTLFLRKALARLCGLPSAALQRGTARRLACLAILALPALADLLATSLWAEDRLFLELLQPWRFLGLLYAQALAVTLLVALALLACWRLLRPQPAPGP